MNHTILFYCLWLFMGLPAFALAETDEHVFTLHGGYFYGPGPIVPDTALPDGAIHGIVFDTKKMEGFATFAKGGKTLSDGKTTTNGNINAGTLEIGGHGEGKTFWLYAVAGGPNEGQERYHFDANYNMIWTVDLALDPGFQEGIVQVNGFQLTTGTQIIPLSLQTQKGLPEGYDKAGSLASGTKLTGRVGDFDGDGFLDGIIVAAANVPMAANMLPGAPVGNLRGVKTDIPIEPLFALELTLHGIANMRPLIEETWTGGHMDLLTARLKDILDRLMAARNNYEAAFVTSTPEARKDLQEIGWRLEAMRQMFYIPLAFLTTYKFLTPNAPNSIVDSTQRALEKTESLAALLAQRRQGEMK